MSRLISRRTFGLSAGALLAASGLSLPARAQGLVKAKMILNWRYQGPQSWFFQAQDMGFLKDEGVELEIDQGEGSAATINRIMSGAYDAGFGDMNAIIQNASTKPADAPVMVYMIYNQPPFGIVLKANSPIKTPKDLEGKKLGGPTGSATTRLFPVFAKANGVDAGKVEILNMAPNLQEPLLIKGDIDGALVFNITSYFNLLLNRQDPEKDFNWLTFGDFGLDLYSNGLMVSQKLIKENPKAVAGLVRAINKAMLELAANPAEGGKVMNRVEPTVNAEIEAKRIEFTYKAHMLTPETEKLGAGDVSDERMTRAIAQIGEAFDLKSTPKVEEVFNRSFLPPLAERKMPAPKS